MRVSKHFELEELIDPETFKKFGDKSRWFICPNLIATLEYLRENLDTPMTINNWNTGGEFKYRGFRPTDCMVGATLSQHRFGRAADFDAKGLTAEKAREYIRVLYSGSRSRVICPITIEEDVPWVHIDVRTRHLHYSVGDFEMEYIYTFKP